MNHSTREERRIAAEVGCSIIGHHWIVSTPMGTFRKCRRCLRQELNFDQGDGWRLDKDNYSGPYWVTYGPL